MKVTRSKNCPILSEPKSHKVGDIVESKGGSIYLISEVHGHGMYSAMRVFATTISATTPYYSNCFMLDSCKKIDATLCIKED